MKTCLHWAVVVLLFLGFSGTAWAQYTAVSATVVDRQGLAYSDGKAQAVLIVPGGQIARVSGLPVSGTAGPATLGASGKFTLNVRDNNQVSPTDTQWQLTIAPQAGTPSASTIITSTGVTQDTSPQRNAIIAPQVPAFRLPSRLQSGRSKRGLCEFKDWCDPRFEAPSSYSITGTSGLGQRSTTVMLTVR